jgi:hypothetical protein
MSPLGRQRGQRRRLGGERDPDRDRAPGDHPIIVDLVAGGNQIVELRERCDARHRDQMASAEPADLAFHTALLVGALNAGAAKEGVKPVFSELAAGR